MIFSCEFRPSGISGQFAWLPSRFESKVAPVPSPDRWDFFFSPLNKHNNFRSGRANISVPDGTARMLVNAGSRATRYSEAHTLDDHLFSRVGRSGTEHSKSGSGQVGRFHELVQGNPKPNGWRKSKITCAIHFHQWDHTANSIVVAGDAISAIWHRGSLIGLTVVARYVDQVNSQIMRPINKCLRHIISVSRYPS